MLEFAEIASWDQVIDWHMHRRPGMEAQDIYKLIYQGVLGAEHLLSDIEGAREHLQNEWEELTADEEVLPIEPIAPFGDVVRLNLSSLKAQGVSWQTIWSLFSAAAAPGSSHREFVRIWKSVISSFQPSWAAFNAVMAEQGYPVVHHSTNYRRLYRPAYRVVRRGDGDLEKMIVE